MCIFPIVSTWLQPKNSLKIPMWKSKDRQHNDKKRPKGQTTIYKTYTCNLNQAPRTPLKFGDKLGCSGRVRSTFSAKLDLDPSHLSHTTTDNTRAKRKRTKNDQQNTIQKTTKWATCNMTPPLFHRKNRRWTMMINKSINTNNKRKTTSYPPILKLLRIFDWVLELFRQCDILFLFLFVYFCVCLFVCFYLLLLVIWGFFYLIFLGFFCLFLFIFCLFVCLSVSVFVCLFCFVWFFSGVVFFSQKYSIRDEFM